MSTDVVIYNKNPGKKQKQNCHMKKQTVSQVRSSPDITQDQKR